MLEWRAKAAGADLLLVPELQLTGYPPEDLVLKPEFVRRTHEGDRAAGRGDRRAGPALLFGTIVSEGGLDLQRLHPGRRRAVVGRTLKHELPNYGTFDEKRVFAPGPLPEPIEYRGVKLGVPICEDIWLERSARTSPKPGAEMLLVPNGSPYELDKDETASGWFARACSRPACRSLISTASAARTSWCSTAHLRHAPPMARLVVQMADWDEAMLLTEWARDGEGWRCETRCERAARSLPRGHLPGDDGRACAIM